MKKLLTTLFGIGVAASLSNAAITISEIHYDNTGADTGEFVEIIVSGADKGTDLSTIAIDLVNGNGGASYASVTLDNAALTYNGVLEGVSTCVFVIDAATFGSSIQNGAPDGVAITVGGTVTEFISYEGVITSTAFGTSTDIGVSESGGAAGTSVKKDNGNTWSVGPDTRGVVPEPSSLLMLSFAGAFAWVARRKKA